MGCGASNPVQISPVNDLNRDNIIRKSSSENNEVSKVNGFPPRNGIKKFNNKVGTCAKNISYMSVGVQTETIFCHTVDEYVQTELFLISELDLMQFHCEQVCDLVQDMSSQDMSSHSDQVFKSVLFQTEQSFDQKSRKKLNLKTSLPSITVDVGIQVRKFNCSKLVQTKISLNTNQRFIIDKNLNNNIIINNNMIKVPKTMKLSYGNNNIIKNVKRSMSMDIDAYKIMEPPLKFDNNNNNNNNNDIEEFFMKKSNLPGNKTEQSNLPGNKTELPGNKTESLLYDVETDIDSLSSPLYHIEKELYNEDINIKKSNKVKLQDSLSKLLDDIDDSVDGRKPYLVAKNDISVQTDNDPITDEAPHYAARPPPCRKKEMIPSLSMFKDIDKRTIEAPVSVRSCKETLVNYLCKGCTSDLYKVRAIFRWITNNIAYDWKYVGVTMRTDQILSNAQGVCKDYCQLFSDLCNLCGIRVKQIQGFAKGHDYRLGHKFVPGQDELHYWNAVYILSAWRLIDTAWGSGYTDHSGKFQKKLNEHFFLTDPEVLIWTHFPYNQKENDYSRWQLLDKPMTLEEFNTLPKTSSSFFDYNLKIRSKAQSPLIFRISTEIKIGAHEPMRYKFKLYPAEEVENSSLNYYVFCQLKEDRLVGSFMVQPPIEGNFLLKIFAKPEREMQEEQESCNLQNVVTFLLECTRARKYIEPFPINEMPWGPTQCFYDYKLRFHNQNGPVIVTWGGKRKLVLEGNETLLVSYQIFDANGMEMDTRNIINREDNGNRVNFIVNPPRVGTFKFVLYGMPKPKQKGKWRLPLLATFLIDCKLAKPPPNEDPPFYHALPANDDEQSHKEKPSSADRKRNRPTM